MGRSVGRSRIRKSQLKNKKKIKKAIKLKVSKISSKIPKVTTIENLNDYCLLKIFEYLSLNDLVNVAVSSPRFNSSTCIVFTHKFAKNVITITNEVLPRSSSIKTLYDPQISQMPSVLLLKSFGHLVEQLRVNYKEDCNRFNHELEQAIIKYSTDYVTEIKFIKADKFAFVQISKPMKAVTKVVFTGCVVNQFISEFNKWFPNANSLELLESTILSAGDVKCIEQKFPKLEHLAIVNPRQHGEGSEIEYDPDVLFLQPIFSNVNVMVAVDLNPQLKSLKLKHNGTFLENHADHAGIKITQCLLAYMNEKLPLLEELDLFVSHDEYTLASDTQRQVHFKSLRKIRFVIDFANTLKNYAISTQHPAKLIITASKSLNGSFAVFLRRNKMWRKIVLNGDWDSYQSYESVHIHLPKFPILSSINICVNGSLNGKQNQVLSLLKDCKFLTKLKVCFSIVRWNQIVQAFDYDLDSDDKRREELKFLDSIKFLKDCNPPVADSIEDDDNEIFYWMDYLSEFDLDSDTDNDTLLQRVRKTLQKLGNSTLEMYRKAFENQRLSLWQSTYHRQDHFFFATFENKDQPKNMFWPIFWRLN